MLPFFYLCTEGLLHQCTALYYSTFSSVCSALQYTVLHRTAGCVHCTPRIPGYRKWCCAVCTRCPELVTWIGGIVAWFHCTVQCAQGSMFLKWGLLHNALWTVPRARFAVGALSAVCTVQCALFSVHCVVCTVQCALCSVHCEVCIVPCVVCTVHCAVFIVHCAVWLLQSCGERPFVSRGNCSLTYCQVYHVVSNVVMQSQLQSCLAFSLTFIHV